MLESAQPGPALAKNGARAGTAQEELVLEAEIAYLSRLIAALRRAGSNAEQAPLALCTTVLVPTLFRWAALAGADLRFTFPVPGSGSD